MSERARGDDADLVATILERLRRRSFASEARYLDLDPYLHRIRYRDSAYAGDPDREYGWWGWVTDAYTEDYSTEDNGFAGLVREGLTVSGFGMIRNEPFPYDPTDRNRFTPAPLYDGATDPDWAVGTGAALTAWLASSDDARLAEVTSMIDGVWSIDRAAWENDGLAVGPPGEFRSWPATHHQALRVTAHNSPDWMRDLSLEIQVNTFGGMFTDDPADGRSFHAATVQSVSQGGGRVCWPSEATVTADEWDRIPHDNRLVVGVPSDAQVDLQQITWIIAAEHPVEHLSPFSDAAIPWTD